MALDFPSNPVDQQVYGSFYYDASTGVWRNVGSKNGLSTRVTSLETANASTNMAGLVPVIPSSVAVGSGSASVSSIGVVTFTGVSSISLNGCFTSNFRNYRMMVNLSATSVTQGVALRARTGTTDRTANYYYQGWRAMMTNATGVWTSDNNSIFHLGDIGLGNADRFNSVVEILSPNIARATTAIWQSHFDNSSTISNLTAGGSIQTTNVDDGITLFPTGGGTIAGEIQVYGYRN